MGQDFSPLLFGGLFARLFHRSQSVLPLFSPRSHQYNYQNAQNRATALVVSRGIIGGILGPHLGNMGVHLFSVPFVGSFAFVGLLCALNGVELFAQVKTL